MERNSLVGYERNPYKSPVSEHFSGAVGGIRVSGYYRDLVIPSERGVGAKAGRASARPSRPEVRLAARAGAEERIARDRGADRFNIAVATVVLAVFCLISACLLITSQATAALNWDSDSGPKLSLLDEDSIRAAREEDSIAAPPHGDWEATEKVEEAERQWSASEARRSGVSLDEDSAHYARGSTLILHIFIDHQGGSWSVSERDAAGAKAELAKNWYLGSAPPAANLSFDNPDTPGYFWFNPYVDINIPEDGMNHSVIDQAIQTLGFSDSDGDGEVKDDFTIAFQGFEGGWDNVIAVFQPADVDGRAFASYSWAVTVQYTGDSASVWRHEWGHSFGACDEYVEDGMCNWGIDCGPCQSNYLDQVFDNGNCALNSCPSDVACQMRNNESAFCEYTRNHWGWKDADSDGRLDRVKRRDGVVDWDWIYTLGPSAAWTLSNEVENSWVMSPDSKNWAVVGLRNPSGADYDFTLYNDNNHNFLRTSSTADGSVVDLVAMDLSHAHPGDEFVQVHHDSGSNANYRISWEGGSQKLYANGLTTLEGWNAGEIVRIWDVSLIGGEAIEFRVDPGSSLDVGMMLFKSDGTAFFGNRTEAVWVADFGGPGAEESYYYAVPEDDVYGLVVYANNAVTTNLGIQIGSAPTILWEETPRLESDALHLFMMSPGEEWIATGVRKGSGVDDVRFSLWDDVTYTDLLVEADDNEGVELAVGLRPVGSGPTMVRAYKDGTGFSNYRIEWDKGEINDGYTADVMNSESVVRVYPMTLDPGTYLFRQYQPTEPNTGFDAGLHLFEAQGAEDYFSRSDRVKGGNNHTPSEGGEWLSHRVFNEGSYALAMTSETPVTSFFELWWGPYYAPPMGETNYDGNTVVFTESEPAQGWLIAAARPDFAGFDVDVFLMDNETYDEALVSSYTSQRTNFCISRRGRDQSQTIYPRFRLNDTRGFHWEWQAPDEEFDLADGPVVRTERWDDNVVEFFTVHIPVPEGVQRDVTFSLEDVEGVNDLAMMLYENPASHFRGRWTDGDKLVNSSGPGADEMTVRSYTDSVEVVVVVFNENEEGGNYTLRIGDAVTSSAESEAGLPDRLSFSLRSENPARGTTEFRLALPQTERVRVGLFDAAGRRVVQLLDEERPAGEHIVKWTARDDRGEPVPPGVYFARVEAGSAHETVKFVKVE